MCVYNLNDEVMIVLMLNVFLFQTFSQKQSAFHAFAVYARLLTCILSSASFATHLHVFWKAEKFWTVTPRSSDKLAYQSFADLVSITFHDVDNTPSPPESLDYPEVGVTAFFC